MQTMWTDEHRRMSRMLGYGFTELADLSENSVRDVVRMVERCRAIGDERLASDEVARELAKRAPPQETELAVLRDIRDTLRDIRARLPKSNA